MDMVSLQNFFLELYSLENFKIADVSAEDNLGVISMMAETGLDANDCLALKVIGLRDFGDLFLRERIRMVRDEVALSS
jgi:hypothetical protein